MGLWEVMEKGNMYVEGAVGGAKSAKENLESENSEGLVYTQRGVSLCMLPLVPCVCVPSHPPSHHVCPPPLSLLPPSQGKEHVRKSALSKSEELTKWHFEDSKTVYECFQRGKRESGECVGVTARVGGDRWRSVLGCGGSRWRSVLGCGGSRWKSVLGCGGSRWPQGRGCTVAQCRWMCAPLCACRQCEL